MTTVRKLSKSVPRPLSLVLGRTCRNAHVVVLPRLPYAHTASGCSLPSAAPHSFGRRFRNVLFSPPHVGGSNSCKLACHGSAFSLQAIPPRVQIQKEGTVSRPLVGSKRQTVSPSVTVFNVDESNALAASVTGK